MNNEKRAFHSRKFENVSLLKTVIWLLSANNIQRPPMSDVSEKVFSNKNQVLPKIKILFNYLSLCPTKKEMCTGLEQQE